MKKDLLNDIKSCIEAWDKLDIYVISLFVYDEGDNICQPTVTLGYNTLTQLMCAMEDGEDEQEAKWNYAFWLQNCELEFGIGESQKVVQKWIKENGFPCLSEDEMDEDNDIDEDELLKITEAFINVLIEVVQELHQSGFIREQFGKDIPILIHELEYYDEIAIQNLKANPPGLLDDFVKFCTGM